MSEVQRIGTIVAEHHMPEVRVEDLLDASTRAMIAVGCDRPLEAVGSNGRPAESCARKAGIDEEHVAMAGLDAMMKSLHDASEFLPPQRFLELKGEDTNRVSPGISLRKGGQYPEVSWIAANSAAAAAHVRRHARVRAIGSVSLEGMPVEKAGDLLRGPVGVPLTLTLSDPDGNEQTISFQRTAAANDPIDCRILGGTVLYLHPLLLAQSTANKMRKLASQAGDSAFKVGVILDLRGNLGGLLDAVNRVADEFLVSGPIVVQRFLKHETQPRAKRGTSLLERVRLAVLIDEETGSGAEALAAALQDSGRATLFGSRTAAKVRIDTILETKVGGAVRFVVAELRRADGRAIDGVGVQPDVAVAPAMVASSVPPPNDVACAGVSSPSVVTDDSVVAQAFAHLLGGSR